MATARTKLWLAGIPIVLLSALFIYFTVPDEALPVRVVEAQAATLVSSLNTNGKVEPTDRQELHASAAGFIRKILVKQGDTVKPGQVIMEMGAGQAEAAAAQAQAELTAAEAEARMVTEGGSAVELAESEQKLREARAAREEAAHILAANERLLKQNAIAREDVEQSRQKLKQSEREVSFWEQRASRRYNQDDARRARARVQSAHAAVGFAQQQLHSTRITSPVSGMVYSLPVMVGNYVNTGDVLARVGNLDIVRVHAFVDEPELGRLAPGLEANVTWDALPGEKWQGKVERVPTEVMPLGTRSVGEVICTIRNDNRKLLANVNVDVEIVFARREKVLTLPKEAVVRADGKGADGAPASTAGKPYVWVVDNNAVHQQAVELGVNNATRFEIRSGLQQGQKVAVPGERPLTNGTRIHPVA